MTVLITYHGHACFSIQTGATHLLIDPFLTGNSMADISASQAQADYILVSHAHDDHLGDTIPIARRTGATVICNQEIANYLEAKAGIKTHGMPIGGAQEFPFGQVKLTIAHHGSSFKDGTDGGSPCGFLLRLEGKLLYHAGDTTLFDDMKLYGEEGIDVAMLPIGGTYTMGPDDAVRAIEFLCPKTAILMHYNTFPVISQDAQAVAQAITARTPAYPALLKPGETMTV